MQRTAARGLAAALACAALLGAVLVAPFTAGAALPTVPEFAAGLESAAGYVTAAQGGLETTTQAAVLADKVRAALPRPARVTEGTRTIDMDLTDVDVALDRLVFADTTAERRDVADELAVRLTALRAAVGSVAATAAPDPADAAALTSLVTALPRASNAGEDWLNTQIEKILDWVSGLFAGLNPEGSAPDPGATRAIMLLVLAVPVVLALVVLIRALRARRRRAGAAPLADIAGPDSAPAVAAAADLPPDALGYAERLAAAGAHRDAVRALYGGAARHLVDAGAVSRMRTRTNLEMLRDVAASTPTLAAPFETLTSEFERDWYGHAEPGSAGFERARLEYERIVDGAPAAPEPDGAPEPVSADPGEPDAPSGGDPR